MAQLKQIEVDLRKRKLNQKYAFLGVYALLVIIKIRINGSTDSEARVN